MRVIKKRPELPQSNMRLSNLSGVCFGGPCNHTGSGMLEDLGSYLDEIVAHKGSRDDYHKGQGLIDDVRAYIDTSGSGLQPAGSGLEPAGSGKSGLLPADELKMELIKQLSRVKKKKKKSKGEGLPTDIALKILPSIINEILGMGMSKTDGKKLLKASLAKSNAQGLSGKGDVSKIAMIPLKMLSKNKKLLKSIEKKIKRELSGGSFWDTLKGIAGTVAPFLPLLL